MIGVEDGNERRAHALQRGVDVARLSILVVGTGLVADASLKGELLKLWAVAVVEDVDVHLVGRPVHIERAQRGVAHHVQGFVIGGYYYINVGPFIRVVGQRHGRPAKRPHRLEVAQK